MLPLPRFFTIVVGAKPFGISSCISQLRTLSRNLSPRGTSGSLARRIQLGVSGVLEELFFIPVPCCFLNFLGKSDLCLCVESRRKSIASFGNSILATVGQLRYPRATTALQPSSVLPWELSAAQQLFDWLRASRFSPGNLEGLSRCARAFFFYNASMRYTSRVRATLTDKERRIFERLNTPQKIQDYLDTLPINFEKHGETYMSPRRMLAAKTAHCFEGALFAAAALAFHGQKPLLLDFQTIPRDEEHVVALFKQNGYWGAISKTNHAILRYRDPVYASVREIAMTYFHEYGMVDGTKSLRTYSAPFDLSRFSPEKWVTPGEDLFWLVDTLDASRHFPIIPKKNRASIRKISRIERRILYIEEWTSQGKRA